MIAFVLALVGCHERGDPEWYVTALSKASDPAAALTDCGHIEDVGARGDCQAAVLDRVGVRDPARCQEVEAGIWRDECIFQVAERMRSAGEFERALSLCHHTRFRRSCGWHLLQDEAQASLGEAPVEAEKRIARFHPERGGALLPDAGVQFWKIRFREQGARGQTLDEHDCDALADPDRCRQAVAIYVNEILDALGRAHLARTCGAPLGKRASTRGHPAWKVGLVTKKAELDWVARHCTAPGGGGPTRPPARRNSD